jgi:hypothetical protein
LASAFGTVGQPPPVSRRILASAALPPSRLLAQGTVVVVPSAAHLTLRFPLRQRHTPTPAAPFHLPPTHH